MILGGMALMALTMIVAWPFQGLWNGVVVEAFSSVRPISYWQSVGLLLTIWICGKMFMIGFRNSSD